MHALPFGLHGMSRPQAHAESTARVVAYVVEQTKKLSRHMRAITLAVLIPVIAVLSGCGGG